MLRVRERSLHVARGGRHPRGHAGFVARRGLGVEHRGERLEGDLGQVDRAPGELGLLGGGHRHAIADVAQHARQGAPLVPRAEHQRDPGESGRGRGVGADDARVGEGRAPQGEVQRAREHDVPGERGLAGRAPQAHRSSSAARAAAASTAAIGSA